MVKEYYKRYRDEVWSSLRKLLDVHGKVAILIASTEYLIGLILQWAIFGQQFVMEETLKWLVVTVVPVIFTGLIVLVAVAIRTPADMDKDRSSKYAELEAKSQSRLDDLTKEMQNLEKKIEPRIEIVHGSDRAFYERLSDHVVCRIGIRNISQGSNAVNVSAMLESISPQTGISTPVYLHWKDDNPRDIDPYSDRAVIRPEKMEFVDVVSVWDRSSPNRNQFNIQHTVKRVGNAIEAKDYRFAIVIYADNAKSVSQELLLMIDESGSVLFGKPENALNVDEITAGLPLLAQSVNIGEYLVGGDHLPDGSSGSTNAESSGLNFLSGGSIPPKEGDGSAVQSSRSKGGSHKGKKRPFDDKGRITRPTDRA